MKTGKTHHEHHVEPGHEADAGLARGDTSAAARAARRRQPLMAIAAAIVALVAIVAIGLTRVNSGVGTGQPTVAASTMPATASGQQLDLLAE